MTSRIISRFNTLSNAQKVALVLAAVACVMLPWLFYLGATLEGQTSVRMWSSTWIGLDCLEITGLVTTAILLLKRKTRVIMAATFTATLFLIDAWFDVMLSQAGADWDQALLSAFVGELPMALLCFYIALTAPAWIQDQHKAAVKAERQLVGIQKLGKALREGLRKQ